MTEPVRDGVRRRTLFVSYLYPSLLGSGSQIRAAALVRMLAAREYVHLLVLLPYPSVAGPHDVEMERLCGKVDVIHFLPAREENARDKVETAAPAGACAKSQLLPRIRQSYEENVLDSLFVFRLESCFLLQGQLDQFPRRFLDLDELASNRIGMLDRLKTVSSATTPETSGLRLQQGLRMSERNFISQFEKIFLSSEIEADEARRLSGSAQIHVLPNIYPDRSTPVSAPVSDPLEILFVGLFSHFPNLDAVLYFHREIFPLIKKRVAVPVIFRVVGSSGSEQLDELKLDPDVRVMGYQKSLEPHYASARLAVVPLRAGSGTRIKILEAFAHGRPVVSTTIGASGLAVTEGRNILLSDTPEGFAEACLRLLEDPALVARLAEEGARLREERYSPRALLRHYDDAMTG